MTATEFWNSTLLNYFNGFSIEFPKISYGTIAYLMGYRTAERKVLLPFSRMLSYIGRDDTENNDFNIVCPIQLSLSKCPALFARSNPTSTYNYKSFADVFTPKGALLKRDIDGDIYFMGNGILLNDKKEPLILIYAEYSTQESDNNIINKYVTLKHFIANSVMLENTKPFKIIRKYIIPHLLTKTTHAFDWATHSYIVKSEMVVTDLRDFIKTNKQSDVATYSNADIYEMINNNIKMITF